MYEANSLQSFSNGQIYVLVYKINLITKKYQEYVNCLKLVFTNFVILIQIFSKTTETLESPSNFPFCDFVTGVF